MDLAAVVDIPPVDPAAEVDTIDDYFNCYDIIVNEKKYLLTAAFCRILSCRVQINIKKFVQPKTVRDFILFL